MVTPAAVIFDLDCTLTDRAQSIIVFSARFAEEYAASLAAEVNAESIAAIIRATDGAGYGSRHTVCRALCQQLVWRQTPSVDRLLRFWKNTFPGCAVARDGVARVLTTLRGASFRLGLISNGSSLAQRWKLRAIDIYDAFDSVLISDEVGLRKPERAIFERSLSQLGVIASRAWYVGDHPVNDVAGARDVGLRPVWVAGIHAWPVDLPQAEHIIHDLDGLIPLIFDAREK